MLTLPLPGSSSRERVEGGAIDTSPVPFLCPPALLTFQIQLWEFLQEQYLSPLTSCGLGGSDSIVQFLGWPRTRAPHQNKLISGGGWGGRCGNGA